MPWKSAGDWCQFTAESMAILSLIDHAVPLWLRFGDAACGACCAAVEPMCSALPAANTSLSDVYCYLAVQIPAILTNHSYTFNILLYNYKWLIRFTHVSLPNHRRIHMGWWSGEPNRKHGCYRFPCRNEAWRSCCIQETSTHKDDDIHLHTALI